MIATVGGKGYIDLYEAFSTLGRVEVIATAAHGGLRHSNVPFSTLGRVEVIATASVHPPAGAPGELSVLSDESR